MNKDEIILRGIDEIPMFTFNTKTKEFSVLGHKFEGVNSIEDFINYIYNLDKENKRLKYECYKKTRRCTERNHRIRCRDRKLERRNKKINKLETKVNQLETNRDEVIEYLTGYEAIHTIQFGVEKPMKKDAENNKTLDKKTIIEMTRRHLIVHDKTLSLLERGKE